jgi:hypothetical protein
MLGHIALHGCARSPEPCHPHTRSDLTSQLRAARSKWWIRNASVRDVLAALTEDTAGAMSEHGGLGAISVECFACKGRRSSGCLQDVARSVALRRQVEEQVQRGNMNFVRNCDEVLAKLSSGTLDYLPPGK